MALVVQAVVAVAGLPTLTSVTPFLPCQICMEPHIQGGWGLHVVHYNALPAAAKIDAWKLYKASLLATAFFQRFSLPKSLNFFPFLPHFVSIFEIQIPEFPNIYISVSAHSFIQGEVLH